MPGGLTRPLTDAIDLVLVQTPQDWASLWEALGEVADPPPNFSNGSVVGLVARIGEPVDGSWPLDVRLVRLVGGWGCLEAEITPGLYHPVIGPAFVELVYVPGLKGVVMVRLGQERFVLR